jgi:hypothetical protein
VFRPQQLLLWQQPSLVSKIFLAHNLTEKEWRFAWQNLLDIFGLGQ